jgi:hypothetical protein
MPALTISTESRGNPASGSGSQSPPRPPMSPITPTLGPSDQQPHQNTQPPDLDLSDPGSGNSSSNTRRPIFSHSTHPEQVPTIPVPPPQPIDFEDNVDVIALKSAISTLQMQSRRAEEDIRTLRDVKQEALKRPEEFARHIAHVTSSHGGGSAGTGQGDAEWPRLPDRIPIARCPPINWSQYAVNGQALDNLHNEQTARPKQGAPASFSKGAYDFNTGSGIQEEYLGPTAPYDPHRDKVREKPRGKK